MKNILIAIARLFIQLFSKKKDNAYVGRSPGPWAQEDPFLPDFRDEPDPILVNEGENIDPNGQPKSDIPIDPLLILWENKLLPEMKTRGYNINMDPYEGNIVFVSGYGLDGQKNDDARGRWNDLCIIARRDIGQKGLASDPAKEWDIIFRAVATTSPGWIPTADGQPPKKGGIAHIKPGQYEAWILWFHKTAKYGHTHPALAQVSPITFTRDFNQDGSPIGDKEYTKVVGLNCHSTKPGQKSELVGFWSEGCAVVKDWNIWIKQFIPILKTWTRYVKSKTAIFAVTFLDGKLIK